MPGVTVPARSTGSGPTALPQAVGATGPQSSASVALVEPPSATEVVEGAVQTWRADLVEAAGGSTLVDIEELGEAALELSAAHPSGLAQLFAGRPTRLSSLVREGAAQTTARRRARAVAARAAVYTQQFGIAPTSLALGVASWIERTERDVAGDDVSALANVTRRPAGTSSATGSSGAGDEQADDEADGPSLRPPRPRIVRAPVLLRPVTLRGRGTGEADYELLLEPTLEVNPVLARALRGRGALLDPEAVARGTFTPAGFDPRGALSRLTSLGEAVLEGFVMSDRVVVGTFVHPGQVLVDDLDALAGTVERHEVLAALAGVESARAELAQPLPGPLVGDRDPRIDRGVGDLDPDSQRVLDLVAAGRHLFVDAPAGTDVTGTLAAMVADAAADGRTVLYVPGHRRAAIALTERLTELGVGDLLLDIAPDAGWRSAVSRRLLGAMTLEPDSVDVAAVEGLRSSLVEHREALRGYVRGLHARRQPWGVSAYDALQHLARLTSARPAPATTVRLAPDVARVLDEPARDELAADLQRAGELGAFTVRPQDTCWYGADVRTDADARVLQRRLERLLDSTLPALVERANQVAGETGLTPPESLAAWAEQLRMLDEIRASLDLFQPMVFERTAADLVAATATKEWRERHGVEMGHGVRRRLRRQARDMVRPGRPVGDLHAALIDVQRRRDLWQTHCPGGGWPRLPDGLEAVEAEHAAVRADLDALDQALASTPAGGRLDRMPLPALVDRLTRLRADSAALDALPARTTMLRRLRAAGLGELVDDLTARRTTPTLARAELELAWWSTVFEQILLTDPALGGYDGATLELLSSRYADLDRAHVASLAAPARSAAVRSMSTALRQHREQAEALFGELVEDRLASLRDAVVRYPDVARRLRPVLAASPMLVPQVLPPTRTVDLVVLDAAAHLPVEIALAALARGRQVVVIGDPRCASGTAVRELSAVLPRVALRGDASRRDPWLTAFLVGHGYAGALQSVPLPDSAPLVRLERVDGTGLPGVESGIVDSPREAVDRVVELVLEHALTHPDESLAVVTVTPRHADVIRDVVLSEARDNPALAAFFDSGRADPFVVVDLPHIAGLRRDAVLLSLGLGRTPHRRVLHSFGAISGPGGEALLLDALGSTGHRLTVVTCFGADDLDPHRLRGAGPRLLADLLDFAERRGAGDVDPLAVRASDQAEGDDEPGADPASRVAPATGVVAATAPATAAAAVVADVPREPDRLVLDLAERLWQHGLVVEVDYGLAGGVHVPLAVGHPAAPDRLLVAVLIDDAAYVDEPSVRVRDRLVPERLERLGWRVLRVWSAAAFLDPQAEVDRIRRAVQAALPTAPAALPTSPRVAPRLTLPDDEHDDVAPPTSAKRPVAARPAVPAPPTRSAPQPRAAAPKVAASPASDATPSEPTEPTEPTEPEQRLVHGIDAVEPDPTRAPQEVEDVAPALQVMEDETSAPLDAVTVAPDPVVVHELPPAASATHGKLRRGRKAGRGGRPTMPAVETASRESVHPIPGPADPAPVGSAPVTSAPVASAPSAPAREGAWPMLSVPIPVVTPSSSPRPPTAPVRVASGVQRTVNRPRTAGVQLSLAVPASARPDVRRGLPIGAYSDDQLDEMVAWLQSDGQDRTRDELADLLREELGLTRRNHRVDTTIRAAITRALS